MGEAPSHNQDLEVAYDARGTVAPEHLDLMLQAYRSMSEGAVRGLPAVTEVAYDPFSAERLDIFGAPGGGLRPVVLAIHGGYWRALSRRDASFMAAVLDGYGIATVSVDYTLAPQVGLDEIVRQVRTAVAWVHDHGSRYGLDSNRIVVVGSSAGAHLAAMTAVRGWQCELGLQDDVVKGCLVISGLFDLRPLVHTSANGWLGLNDGTARALSPALLSPADVPTRVLLAAHEATGFQAQSAMFDRLRNPTSPTLQVIANRNHFDVFLDLADDSSVATTTLLGLVEQS